MDTHPSPSDPAMPSGPAMPSDPAMSPAPMPGVKDNILQTIGDTPIVLLHKVAAGLAPDILAKVQYFNPGASVTDRGDHPRIDGCSPGGRDPAATFASAPSRRILPGRSDPTRSHPIRPEPPRSDPTDAPPSSDPPDPHQRGRTP